MSYLIDFLSNYLIFANFSIILCNLGITIPGIISEIPQQWRGNNNNNNNNNNYIISAINHNIALVCK